jgi:hypothetical protein
MDSRFLRDEDIGSREEKCPKNKKKSKERMDKRLLIPKESIPDVQD